MARDGLLYSVWPVESHPEVESRRPYGFTVWITGISGAGKSETARALELLLVERGLSGVLLDADTIRSGLNSDLGFSPEDRRENVRRIGEVAKMFALVGSVAVVASISPFEEDRHRVQTLHSEAGLDFVEVYMATALEVCRLRDGKGLYRDELPSQGVALPGSAAPYDPPSDPDLVFDAAKKSAREIAEEILTYTEPMLERLIAA